MTLTTMYAIIEIQWHQYIVTEGDVITVDRMKDNQEGDKITLDALSVFEEDGSTVKVWTPVVTWATVACEVTEHTKGVKIHVHKFKRKNRYTRKMGFRPQYSTLSIKKISA